MERATKSWTASCLRFGRRQGGASIVEAVIALPILLAVILGAIQFALVYEAKATLNHASLQAARLGAVRNADPEAIRRGLARGLTALHSPESSLSAFARTRMNVEASLATDARIRILNPTREAFDDFGVDVDGEREIPNDRLHARSAAVGAQSGISIQDANLLKVQITYGYELQVPLVNWFIARVLLGVTGSADAFEQQLLRRMRLPIVATATVRMQSPARLSEAVVSKSDFPDLERIPAHGAPAAENDSEQNEEEAESGESSPSSDDADEGSGLDDGFFGFGEGQGGAGGGTGGGERPGGDEGGVGGGLNGGSPQQCPIDDGGGGSPFPFDDGAPGGSSPVPDLPAPWLDTSGGVGSAASIGAISIASLSVGNPIHVATGNKFQMEVDIDALPGALGLELRRYYNSGAVNEASVLGAGWRHSYQARLRRRADRIELVQADGRLIVFSQQANTPALEGSARFVAQRASDGVVVASGDGFRWLWRSGRENIFDADGRLVRIVALGRELELRYEGENLIAVVDPEGRTLRFEYYRNGRLAKVRGPGGLGIAYAYDAAGNLVHAANMDGQARRYIYEDARHPHHLSGISVGTLRPLAYGERRPFERIASWKYDEHGRAVYSSHPDDAGRVTLAFGDGYTDATDAFGRTTRYVVGWRDGIAYVSEVHGPGCSTCGQGDVRYTYDARFQPLAIVAKHGPALHFRYDADARLVQVDREYDGRREWLVRYAYEGSSPQASRIERPSVMAGAAAVTELEYSSSGPVERVRERGFSPEGDGYRAIARETSIVYDARGRVRRIDGPRTDVNDWTDFEYDDRDRVVAIKLSDVERRVLEHDASGRPTLIAQTGRPNLKLAYDVRGRVKSIAQLRAQGAHELTFSYDHAGRLSRIADSRGRHIRYGFDTAGRVDRVSSSDSDVTAIARYAPDDRLERIVAFGAHGQLLRALYFVYDAERRLTEVRDGEGPPLQQLEYVDGDPLPDRKVDPLGNQTRFAYDGLGQLASLLAPDGGTTRIERDSLGRMTKLTAPNDAATWLLYDDFGRRVREVSADRGETSYVYDAADNLVEKTDARGARTRLKYDAANRLVEVERLEGTTKLSYADGLLTHMHGEVADERYEYDRDGQLVTHRREIGGRSFTTRFSYDAQGRLAMRELPSGVRLRYVYAPNGVLQSIVQARWLGDRVLAQTKLAKSAIPAPLDASRALTFGNGIAMRTTFDARSGNLSRRAIEGIATLMYEHDDAGRITSIRRDGDAREHAYDAVGRLVGAKTQQGEFGFSYDTNGNRLEVTHSRAGRGRAGEGASLRYEYAPNTNRLTRVADMSYTYDAAGNPLDVGSRRYEYDTGGRPTRLYESGRLVSEYRYNLRGERVQKIVHANGRREVTNYVYENQQLIAEADERGRIVREYVYSGRHPVALLEDRRAYWVHTDHLGTPIAVTDERRNMVWRAHHHPFGAAEIDADPDGDKREFTLNLRFPGQYADVESGTSYNYFRDYDPETGRYLTPDPIGVLATTNIYSYASNRPSSAFDRLGLYQEDIHYYMTLFLAITAGVDPLQARHMALASAFVDVNATTRPTNPTNQFTTALSALENQPQLLLYHFVLSDQKTGETLPEYRNSNYYHVAHNMSPQLNRMLGYATSSPHYVLSSASCAPDLANLQFYGEFLHAFADTYAHRAQNDRPYDALAIGLGLGHSTGWHWPDYTYNASGWITRETRTLGMELDLRDAIRNSRWADPSRSTTHRQFDTLVAILMEFNAIREDEQTLMAAVGNRSASEMWLESEKVRRLNEGLRQLGYEGIDLTSEQFRFSEEEARRLRVESFRHLDPAHYTHAILETR